MLNRPAADCCDVCGLQSTLQRVGNRSNVADMSCQPFYKWIQDTYTWHVVGLFAALYAVGGFPAMVWGGALRIAFVYHITWFVNSASHCWGYQSYNTGATLIPYCLLLMLNARNRHLMSVSQASECDMLFWLPCASCGMLVMLVQNIASS